MHRRPRTLADSGGHRYCSIMVVRGIPNVPVVPVSPHMYFWKSARWVRGLELLDHNQPGFWVNYGYQIYGDPWRQQRYAGD